MAFVLTPVADGQVVTVPQGVTTGTVFAYLHDLVYRGESENREDNVLRLDGVSGTTGFVFPYPPQTLDDEPVRKITLQRFTIDANNVANLVSVFTANGLLSGPIFVEMNDILIVGHNVATIALALVDCGWSLRNVEIRGDGLSIVINGTLGGEGYTISAPRAMFADSSGDDVKIVYKPTTFDCVMRDITIVGGRGGVIVADVAGKHVNFYAKNVDVDLSYWQAPSGEEVVPTAFATTYVDVTSHVALNRSLYDVLRVWTEVDTGEVTSDSVVAVVGAEPYDRVEDASGNWAQVYSIDENGDAVVGGWCAENSWRPVDPPAAETAVTCYRLTLGRLLNWTDVANRLKLISAGGQPPSPHWYKPNGAAASTPVLGDVVKMDIVLVGTANRRADVGPIHLTDPSEGCWLSDCTSLGGWSDQITIRGRNNWATRCRVDRGQDMGYTITGQGVVLDRCSARRQSFDGFLIAHDPLSNYQCDAILYHCRADACGVLTFGQGPETQIGFGVALYDGDTPNCRVDLYGFTGTANVNGLVGGQTDDPDFKGRG